MGGIATPATYSADLRPLAVCPPSVQVPAAVSAARPRVGSGTTAVLRVGAAVRLDVADGARVGLTGAREAGETAVVCRSRPAAGTSPVLVARRLGYVRVGVVRGRRAQQPALVFVKVTP